MTADVSCPWNFQKQWKTPTGRDLKDPSEIFKTEIGNRILIYKNVKMCMYKKATKNFLAKALSKHRLCTTSAIIVIKNMVFFLAIIKLRTGLLQHSVKN